MIRPTRALISLRAIRHNTRVVLDLIGPIRKLLVMVKADAYGHGAVAVAKAALDEGASFLGVALVEEGIALRHSGFPDAPILVFTSLMPRAAEPILEHNLIPTLSSVSFAEVLNRAALAAGKVHPVHIDVDTGMGRFGFRVEDPHTLPNIRAIAAMKGLAIQGIMTHFASADEAGCDFTRTQLKLFRNLLDALDASGIRPPLVHVANTAGILCHPDSHESMVRLGLGLYGYYPDPTVPHTVEFVPCLELLSSIIHLKTCAAGSPIGYGRTFTAKRSTRVATIPVGYADGYPRELSNRGCVSVLAPDKSTRTVCPVIGRVCMDDILVDVTDVPGVAVYDEVVIYSSRREDPNSVESIASLLGTIPYVLPTHLSSRVPRIHVES